MQGKLLTNIRMVLTDDALPLNHPLKMSLEQALAFVEEVELVEGTFRAVRIRRIQLVEHERKRAKRATGKP
jgi:GTP-binding protein